MLHSTYCTAVLIKGKELSVIEYLVVYFELAYISIKVHY